MDQTSLKALEKRIESIEKRCLAHTQALKEQLLLLMQELDLIKQERENTFPDINNPLETTGASYALKTKIEYLTEVNEQLAQQNQRLRSLIEKHLDSEMPLDKSAYFKALRGDA